MNKFDEILNSSDASDALLGEQIDKCVKNDDYEIVVPEDIIAFKSGYTASGGIRRYGRIYTGWMYVKGTFAANTATTFGVGKIGNHHLYSGGAFYSNAEWTASGATYAYIGGIGNNCVAGGSGMPASTGIYINFTFAI